jgi:DNA-binding response OmpR family regulator
MGRVLLIEPDRVLAGMYRLAFEREGHDVMMCASAQSAVFAADEWRPDIVVLELQLIGHSGIEFLYEFRSYTDWQLIPVIILSQVPAAEFSDSWNMLKDEIGVKAYYYKPFTSLKILTRAVAEQLADPPAISVAGSQIEQ